jgi:hypothetical protein
MDDILIDLKKWLQLCHTDAGRQQDQFPSSMVELVLRAIVEIERLRAFAEVERLRVRASIEPNWA